MDKGRYLKHKIQSTVGLRSAVESCKGTLTLMSDKGHIHYVFRHFVGKCGWEDTDRIFVYSPTPHGCAYVGEFTGCKFRLTTKSEFTKYSAEFRGIQYIEKILNHEILNPKLEIYIDTDGFDNSGDFYADKVFNFRGIDNE